VDAKAGQRLVAELVHDQIAGRGGQCREAQARGAAFGANMTVATAIEQAADAADRQSDADCRRYEVGEVPHRQTKILSPTKVAPVETKTDSAADRRSVKDQAAFPELVEVRPWNMVLDHVDDPSADNSKQEHPEGGVVNSIFVDPLAPAAPHQELSA